MKRKLTIKEVATFLQKDIEDMNALSKLISAMFPLRGEDGVDDRNKCFTVFHKSVLDWLTDEMRSGVDNNGLKNVEESFYININGAIQYFVERLSLQFVRSSDIEWIFPEGKNSYLINHFLDHLDGAGNQLESKQLLMSLPWMMKILDEKGIMTLIGEFKSRINDAATTQNNFDIAFKTIMDALKLSHEILSKQGQIFPIRLPIQLYGRLNGVLSNNSYLQTLKESCEKWFDQNLKFQPKRLYLEAPGGSLESKFQLKEVS
jgi:hypothetical protein